MFFDMEQMNTDFMNSLIAIGIFLLFLFLRKLFTKHVYKIILYFTKKTTNRLLPNIWMAFETPIRTFLLVIGFHIAAQYFPFINAEAVLYKQIIITLVIILITWGLYNLSSTSSIFFHKLNDRLEVEIDQILIPFLSKTLQFIVVVIGLSIIVQVFGYNINSIVAGLGIGGLAVALAAQDALSNLFGGIIIITEKPFTIDDWIETPSVQGTVEDINFRSTKVRTFAQAIVVIPNATLARETITNWTEMGKRRITFELSVAKNTPPKRLENVVTKINDLLRHHEEIHQDTIVVTFDSFDTCSLDIYLYFFTKTTAWGEYLQIKQEINFHILEILAEENVALAQPVRELYVKQEGFNEVTEKQRENG